MNLLDDNILHQIIRPLLDLQSLINFHFTCRDYKLLFEDKISELKPYYINGNRYKILEKLIEEYSNIPDKDKRPENHQPSATASWSRIDNSILNIQFNSAYVPAWANNTKLPLSHYKYQLGYDFFKADEILDKWFDFIKEGDVIVDDKYSASRLTYFTIIEKSKYTKTQIYTKCVGGGGIGGINSISPLCKILIPPRTDILIE